MLKNYKLILVTPINTNIFWFVTSKINSILLQTTMKIGVKGNETNY